MKNALLHNKIILRGNAPLIAHHTSQQKHEKPKENEKRMHVKENFAKIVMYASRNTNHVAKNTKRFRKFRKGEDTTAREIP